MGISKEPTRGFPKEPTRGLTTAAPNRWGTGHSRAAWSTGRRGFRRNGRTQVHQWSGWGLKTGISWEPNPWRQSRTRRWFCSSRALGRFPILLHLAIECGCRPRQRHSICRPLSKYRRDFRTRRSVILQRLFPAMFRDELQLFLGVQCSTIRWRLVGLKSTSSFLL